MQPRCPQDWSDHLRAVVAPVLEDTPLGQTPPGDAGKNRENALRYIDTFSDERGDRRAVDRPLLARLLGVAPGPRPELHERHTDLILWWALHDGSPIDGVVAPAPGPLIGGAAFESGAIETNTETELGALHALAHHAERDPRWSDRVLDAARWHVATLQPDNGTNHPWAVHVFVNLSFVEPDPAAAAAARLHAETLVHNSLVSRGRPDRFSACLLLDAARVLARIDQQGD